MFTEKSVNAQDNRLVIESSFDLSAAAAVLSITAGTTTKTARGQGMSCVKSGTGQYDVTLKTSNMSQGPVFQPVELLYADATLVGATVATALAARVASVTVSAAGDLVMRVLTISSAGAAVDTTGAITVSFQVVVVKNRMDSPL